MLLSPSLFFTQQRTPHTPMARGLPRRDTLWQLLLDNVGNPAGTHLPMAVLGMVCLLLMGLSAVAMVLSLCARRQVGDRNSDGDGGGGGSPVAGKKRKVKVSMEAGEEALQQQQQQQQNQNYIRSPVWQRTILMGERCKKPTFSGLILYDDKGNPLPIKAAKTPRTHVPPPFASAMP